jgi:hypothetical protein
MNLLLCWTLLIMPPVFADEPPQTNDPPLFTKKAIGVQVGEPIGITAKGWIQPEMAIDAGLGFALKKYWMLYSDFLYHLDLGWDPFIPYGGAGLVVAFPNLREGGIKGEGWTSWAIGLRFPIGIEWFTSRRRFAIYLEVAPVYPAIPFRRQLESVFVEGGLGGRFYF